VEMEVVFNRIHVIAWPDSLKMVSVGRRYALALTNLIRWFALPMVPVFLLMHVSVIWDTLALNARITDVLVS